MLEDRYNTPNSFESFGTGTPVLPEKLDAITDSLLSEIGSPVLEYEEEGASAYDTSEDSLDDVDEEPLDLVKPPASYPHPELVDSLEEEVAPIPSPLSEVERLTQLVAQQQKEIEDLRVQNHKLQASSCLFQPQAIPSSYISHRTERSPAPVTTWTSSLASRPSPRIC